MTFLAEHDHRMFVGSTGHNQGKTVVIVDDRAFQAVREKAPIDDDRFLIAIKNRLAEWPSVSRIVFTNFDFEVDWLLGHALPTDCLYLIDMYAGQGEAKQIRGPAVIAQLERVGVPREEIAILSKAPRTLLCEQFGEDHRFVHIGKGVDLSGNDIGNDEIRDFCIARVLNFVTERSADSYVKSCGWWGAKRLSVDQWFPISNPRHNASWWVTHGLESAEAEAVESGRACFRDLLKIIQCESLADGLSVSAVFCGLKCLSKGWLSARLLCEIAGVKVSELDSVVYQIISVQKIADIPQVLLAVAHLSSPNESPKMHFSLTSVNDSTLVLQGRADFQSNEEASKAAATLSKTPVQRMKNEPERTSAGNGVTAVHKLRTIADKSRLKISSSNNQITMIVHLAIKGNLEEVA